LSCFSSHPHLKATDLLLGILARSAGGQAKSQKRRTVQMKDFVQVWGVKGVSA
jgi:histone H3/H4